MKRLVVCSDRIDGLIGIWWYDETTDEVMGTSQNLDDGDLYGNFIQPSGDNHMTAWKKIARNEKERSKGFKSLYRGRVIFDTQAQCYQVTCSKDLLNDETFRKAIIDFYQLSSCRREFVPLEHYRSKLSLTGNPAVDSTYYDI